MLAARRQYSRRLPCYLCGETGVLVSKDHIPPQRLYKRPMESRPEEWPSPPSNWPTAALCYRCKHATDQAEDECFEALVVGAGGDTGHWRKYIDDHKGKTIWGKVAKRHDMIEYEGERRDALTFSASLISHYGVKLARGLWWVLNAEVLPLETPVQVDYFHGTLDTGSARHQSFGPWFDVFDTTDGADTVFYVRYFGRVGFRLRIFNARLPQ